MPAPQTGPFPIVNPFDVYAGAQYVQTSLVAGIPIPINTDTIVPAAGDFSIRDRQGTLPPVYIPASLYASIRQSAGTLRFPIGSPTGSTVIVTDALVRSTSIILLTAQSAIGTMTDYEVTAVTNGSFTVTMHSTAILVSNVDIAYLNLS